MKTPSCYNRDPFTSPESGWKDTGMAKLRYGPARLLPIYRYRWPWFADRCEAWNPGPGHVRDTVPARECWACDGCKWLPAHARAWIRGEDDCD